ncbi:fungal-specific transcription factor domain-containing protein [Trametes gibbosa]|uniref:Zn(2)-Cys(6)49 n=1 Tax=Trametes gibbosa TaxID=160864 RepID=A0A976XI86_9APHY|nr:fungal-specific transcription factor domain-containing protein [Trametes gibbosa]UVB64071.1 Zn(2)-Cys(6)49 [Trametes gibbosa]
MGLQTYGGGGGGSALGAKAAADKQIRRRSSKACDQCRKSKCKCERGSPHDPCRNCVMLGTQCTFLGPSRKRGPPKGYIDAIEARLHQTEALIGILLSSKDSRAKSVLDDLAEDPLAKEIIGRVDNSPYGFKGRSRGVEAPTSRARPPPEARDGEGGTTSPAHATHPSNEWQDRVIGRLNALAASRNTLLPDDQVASGGFATATAAAGAEELGYPDEEQGSRPSSSTTTTQTTTGPRAEGRTGDARRQRRRLDEHGEHDGVHRSPSTTATATSRSPMRRPSVRVRLAGERETGESGEDEIALALGQLSINEDEQVRFHGKASGLHMLGEKERQDGRNEGGLWRFPKARVWPPLPNGQRRRVVDEFAPRLPDAPTQELLLELYFTYVHPALPIVHKRTFMDDFRNGNMNDDSPYSGESGYSDAASPISASSPIGPRKRRVPTLLLLAMFSLAARYSSQTAEVPPPEDDGAMWTAGDGYMEDAKVILDRTYAASRPSTCQALLLLGYREVGIGAMAQAWLYVGMAVRMAQDLGLHKSAETWTAVGGRSLFSRAALQERRRVWYGCVVMDKYVCTYIGRPVAICERDFDTELPLEEDGEEMERWRPHGARPVVAADDDRVEARWEEIPAAPGRILSCFNERAKLSVILSEICQTIYAIKPPASRPAELVRLDSLLTKWSLELPEHLRFDCAAPRAPPPPPNILTLHMQYWCTVLLLHRPLCVPSFFFFQFCGERRGLTAEIRANSRQHYDMCVQAANHITLIVSLYGEYYSPSRASVFLCYYVFTAAIMHVATLRTYPDDPQGSLGLRKCMDVLQRMRIIWPSAWRALELLHGAKAQLGRPTTAEAVAIAAPRHKRVAEEEPVEEDAHTQQQQAQQQPQQVYSVATPSSQSQGPSPSLSHGQNQHQSQHQAHQPQGYTLPMDLSAPGAAAAAYLPASYDRWGADSSVLSGFGGSLSTSVLPQQYSTGLVDERLSARGGGGHGHGHGHGHGGAERQSTRYPPYWNDYSALGQMETTYGVPVMGELVQGHDGAPQGAAADGQGLYVQDQYAMFGALLSSLSCGRHPGLLCCADLRGCAGNLPPSSQQ